VSTDLPVHAICDYEADSWTRHIILRSPVFRRTRPVAGQVSASAKLLEGSHSLVAGASPSASRSSVKCP
jgi:hypothetical protein